MVRDGLVFKDEDGQVIFNQYSFCELVKHLLVELVGISYEEALSDSGTAHRWQSQWPMPWEWRYSAMTCLITGLCFFYYGNGYWLGDKGIPAQPEDMDAYEAWKIRSWRNTT